MTGMLDPSGSPRSCPSPQTLVGPVGPVWARDNFYAFCVCGVWGGVCRVCGVCRSSGKTVAEARGPVTREAGEKEGKACARKGRTRVDHGLRRDAES